MSRTRYCPVTSVVAADVDGDRDLDVVSAINDGTIRWHENDGTPAWPARVIETGASWVNQVVVADVDGDGYGDVVANYNAAGAGTTAWYRNPCTEAGCPAGEWPGYVISTTPSRDARSVFAADVNGDGYTDVLAASYYFDRIVWYENDGTSPPGGWTPHALSTDLNGTWTFAADLDGDGDLDVVSSWDEANTIYVFEQKNVADPNLSDSDGDGVNDGDEVANGTDPLVADSPPTNQAPSCDPGVIPDLECDSGPLSIQLDGTGSSDPEGQPLTYSWNVACQGPSSLDDPSSATPLLSIPEPLCGNQSCSVNLTVNDGLLAAACPEQSFLILPKPSVEDMAFEEAASSIQVPAGTQTELRLGVQNSGVCPAGVSVVEVEKATSGPSPTVDVVGTGIDPPPSQLSGVCSGAHDVVLTIDAPGNLPERSYPFIVTVTGADGSRISADLDVVVVGEPEPDLTPISAAPPSVVITGQTGSPPLDVAEPATLSSQIRNTGAAPAAAYEVNFFADREFLGSLPFAAGLAPGASSPASLTVSDGLDEGTHVIRVEVVSAPGAESDFSNYAATGLVQVGSAAPGSGAEIRVSGDAAGACEDGIAGVSGKAWYVLTSQGGTDETEATFPVQGGITGVQVFPTGGSTPLPVGAQGHTDTGGRFSLYFPAPAPGDYDAVVEVTDLTLTGSSLPASFTVQTAAACTPPPPPPPPDPQQQELYLDLKTCEKNAAGGAIAWDDRIFVTDADDNGCPSSELLPTGLRVRAEGTWSPARLQLAAALLEEDGSGGLGGSPYATTQTQELQVPFDEISLAGKDCVSRPGSDAVLRLDVSDSDGMDPELMQVTQLAPASVPTGTIHLEVEDLHTEAACWPEPRVFGHVRYATDTGSFAQGIPLACGTVRATLIDQGTQQPLPDVPVYLSTTGVSGGFGVSLATLPQHDVTYGVRVEISDGVIRDKFETTIRCSQGGSGLGGGPAPPVDGTPNQDLFVFAEDVFFLGDGTCSVGLAGTPEPGDPIGIAATIHLAGADTPILGQTITVKEYLPTNGVLEESEPPIGTATVDFLAPAKHANICVPYTPQTPGWRIVQVDIEPDEIAQYPFNDAATRALAVGREPCTLQLSRRTLVVDRGGSASLSLSNAHDEGITPVLDLSLLPRAGQSLPAGLTSSFSSETLVGNGEQTLTLGTSAATPPGRFPLVVLASGLNCTALASLTLIVNGRGPDLDPIPDQSLQCGVRSVEISASDPEGDDLTLSASGLPGFVSLIDSGSGAGRIEIDAGPIDAGAYTGLTVTATDAYGFFDTESFELEVTDRAPVVSTPASAALSCLGGSISVSASDADGDPLRLELSATLPFIGLVDQLNGSGTVEVAAGIPGGEYAVEVVATDQACGARASASFPLTVANNSLPSISAIGPQEVRAGESLSLGVSSGDPEGGGVNVSGVSLPAFARLEPAGAGSWTLTLEPGDADVGVHSLVLEALDACAGISSASFELTVLPANRAPTADAGDDQSAGEGTPVTLDGSGSADPDGDTLTYAWVQLAGQTVVLGDPSAEQPSFAAPHVVSDTTLTFQLIVSDASVSSEPDTVDVTIANVNDPPVADAGDDTTLKEGAVGSLDGSGSYDPEGDTPLDYGWTQISGPAVTLSDPASPTPSFTAPQGVGTELVFELQVGDGQEIGAPDSVKLTVVENSPPIANAGPDQTEDEGSPVALDGSGSSDPDGDALSFAWSQLSGPPVALSNPGSPTPSFTAPPAPPGGLQLEFRLILTDDDPLKPRSAMDTVVVSVVDTNAAPRCDLARSICPESKFKSKTSVDGCILWPPNHKMIAVEVTGVTDEDGEEDDLRVQITGVTQDEPVDGLGDGDTSPDAIIQPGEPADSVLLRSERTGLGGAQENGRVYAVQFTATDGFESCTGSVAVGVPHDRKDTPVDDGQLFDSTQP